jgi:hypothetical protein
MLGADDLDVSHIVHVKDPFDLPDIRWCHEAIS